MAVDNTKVIDGMGKSKEKNELILLITDHLNWDEEYEHLKILQDKINAYASYIESKQFDESYPNENFDSFLIEIHFKYDIVENCIKFLEVVANQLEILNIKIRAEIVE
jgi:hypothetical protein